MKPKFYAFWAINGKLEASRLRRQLEQFRGHGFDGVVWHPRFYPGEPPYLGDRYLAELSDTIIYAKSLGLAFWLYDEDGWPSGTAGGQLLRQYPEDAQRFANLVTVRPERCLAEFVQAGTNWFLAEAIGPGVDYFNPELARHFIGLTHERYRSGLKPEAWRHVEAIFCDEPEFGLGHAYASLSPYGAIPWTPELPELFRQRYGEALLPQISQLFFPGPAAADLRVKFWELLTDRFNGSFTRPINQWCRDQGKLFTAHVKGEEHPFFQVPTHGSSHQFYRALDLPAIDALERFPGNDFYPRQLSAAARQFGSGRCMVEALGGSGWGVTPEDWERYLLWLGRHGITDFVLHLSQYRLDSAAMQDWPPSQPLHLTWREACPAVLRQVREELERHPRPAADTLVVVPNRGIMADFTPQEFLQTNVHNAATYPDTAAGRINRAFLKQVEALHREGVNYDVTDERTLEQSGQLVGGELKLGYCTYRRVLIPTGCRLHPATIRLVQSLTRTGDAPAVTVSPAKPAPATGTTVTVDWKLAAQPLNSFRLEPVGQSDGTFAASFDTNGDWEETVWQIVFADDIASLSFNGRCLPLETSDEGTVVRLMATDIAAVNTLRFRPVKTVEHPFVWVKGCFRVHSRSAYLTGPNGTVKTAGPFRLQPVSENIPTDLLAAGFPFLQTGLAVSGEIFLPQEAAGLQLAGVEAVAVRLTVGGKAAGWTWRRAGQFTFSVRLAAGKQRLTLELLPNTFNGFGPHHYYAGDWPVISPAQIQGVRNFADAPDAPANTHVAAWHFRPFRLPDTLVLI